MATQRQEPFAAFAFRVEIDLQKLGLGTPALHFRSCTGLKSESAMIDVEEGGWNATTRKLIGRTKFPNIVLKHGYSSDRILWQLRQRFQNDMPLTFDIKKQKTTSQLERGRILPNRFNGVITALGPQGAARSVGFANGLICKWEGPDLDATKNEVAVETIEIAHEGLFDVPEPK